MRSILLAAALLALAGCASVTPVAPRVATPGAPVVTCDALAARFSYANTRVASAERVAGGQLRLPGIAEPMPEHCLVKGAMNERTSPVDGKRYAISFEMRLPTAWNGRFFYQANGGLAGFMTPAYGDILGGGQASNGVLKGFAVISSYALAWDIEGEVPKLGPAMEFMSPPDPLMRRFVARGGKMIVFHGTADPVFSALDTIKWHEDFHRAHGRAANDHERLYLVPGMNHSRGGPATDQVDMVDELVRWVEGDQAPGPVVARARGVGAAVPNPEVPANWAPDRTRPLCPYPQVARYRGTGNVNAAASFSCQ